MSSRDWNYGVLREDFGPLSSGCEVFYRKMTTSYPLAAGVCWWVRPRFEKRFFCVAESYGGDSMAQLIKMNRNGSLPIRSSGEATIKLNRQLRAFQSSLPEDARVRSKPVSHHPLKSLLPK